MNVGAGGAGYTINRSLRSAYTETKTTTKGEESSFGEVTPVIRGSDISQSPILILSSDTVQFTDVNPFGGVSLNDKYYSSGTGSYQIVNGNFSLSYNAFSGLPIIGAGSTIYFAGNTGYKGRNGINPVTGIGGGDSAFEFVESSKTGGVDVTGQNGQTPGCGGGSAVINGNVASNAGAGKVKAGDGADGACYLYIPSILNFTS